MDVTYSCNNQQCWFCLCKWTCAVAAIAFLSLALLVDTSYYFEATSQQNKTKHTSHASHIAGIPGAYGVDPVYLELYQEAKRRYEHDYSQDEIPHQQGERGFVIGPTDGAFKHTLNALRNGRRFRVVLADKSRDADFKFKPPSMGPIRLCLMTSERHLDLLNQCKIVQRNDRNSIQLLKKADANAKQVKEACALWANNTLFDDVITIPNEIPYKVNDKHSLKIKNRKGGTSAYWLKALNGYLLAPYQHSMFVDTDAYPCPAVERIFALTDPNARNFKTFWQMKETGPGDLAIGLAEVSNNDPHWTPGDETILTDCESFAKRNTGTVLWSFLRPHLVHTFTHFIPLVAEHVYNNVATTQKLVKHDQAPFQIALYLFKRFEPDFIEHQIPMHTTCRSYPGKNNSKWTNGFENGMYPIQQDGSHCHECYCTPCLIIHNVGPWHVTINGTMGWEL